MESPKIDSRNQLVRTEPSRLDVQRPHFPISYNASAPESTVGDYYRILQKHKGVIIASVLIVVTLVTIATFRMTPMYEAAARIAISKEDSSENLRLNSQSSADTDWNYDYNVELDTQAKILQCDTLALRVIDELHLAQEKAFGGQPRSAQANSAKPAGLDTRKESEFLGVWHGGLAVNKIPRTRMIE